MNPTPRRSFALKDYLGGGVVWPEMPRNAPRNAIPDRFVTICCDCAIIFSNALN